MTIYFSDFVIKLALILIFSILPSLVYLSIFRKAKERWQTRLRRAQNITHYDYREQFYVTRHARSENQEHYLGSDRRRAVAKYFIGDTSCVNNAQSPYIRCAIKPEGPCEDCAHYEQRYQQSKTS